MTRSARGSDAAQPSAHSYAAESLRLGAGLRDVQDADGSVHALTIDVPVPWTPLLVIVAVTLLGTALLAAVAVPLVHRSAHPGELRTE